MKLFVAMLMVLAGCDSRVPQGPIEDKGGGYQVALLFKHDGCSVYRFFDRSHERYFVNCGGAGGAGTCNERTGTCGKNCVHTAHDPSEVPSSFGGPR